MFRENVFWFFRGLCRLSTRPFLFTAEAFIGTVRVGAQTCATSPICCVYKLGENIRGRFVVDCRLTSRANGLFFLRNLSLFHGALNRSVLVGELIELSFTRRSNSFVQNETLLGLSGRCFHPSAV